MFKNSVILLSTSLLLLTGVLGCGQANEPNWVSTAVYEQGNNVTFQNFVYQALWQNSNQSPEAACWGPWQRVEQCSTASAPTCANLGCNVQCFTTTWSQSVCYKLGDPILDVGKVYVASSTNTGSEPQWNPQAWNLEEDCTQIQESQFPDCENTEAWKAGITYHIDDLVVYDEFLWRAQWNAEQIPDENCYGPWDRYRECPNREEATCENAEQWEQNVCYFVHDRAIYNGNLYQAEVKQTGSVPNVPGTANWELVQNCFNVNGQPSQNGSPTCGNAFEWEESVNYVNGAEVSYSDYLWQSSWDQSGNEPGLDCWGPWARLESCSNSAPDNCSNAPEWSNSVCYRDGDMVIDSSSLYEAVDTSIYSKPEYNAHAWQLINSC